MFKKPGFPTNHSNQGDKGGVAPLTRFSTQLKTLSEVQWDRVDQKNVNSKTKSRGILQLTFKFLLQWQQRHNEWNSASVFEEWSWQVISFEESERKNNNI